MPSFWAKTIIPYLLFCEYTILIFLNMFKSAPKSDMYQNFQPVFGFPHLLSFSEELCCNNFILMTCWQHVCNISNWKYCKTKNLSQCTPQLKSGNLFWTFQLLCFFFSIKEISINRVLANIKYSILQTPSLICNIYQHVAHGLLRWCWFCQNLKIWSLCNHQSIQNYDDILLFKNILDYWAQSRI